MSKVITFEGIDGSGKTTVIQEVKKNLEEKGYSVIVISEPGTTSMGEHLRTLIKSNVPRHPSTDLLLFLAARNDMVKQVLVPALTIYDYILMDRYVDSTLAYQGYGLGMDKGTIMQFNRLVTKDVRIDHTIYLEVPIQEAQARRALRGQPEEADKYEDNQFLKRVRSGYQEIIRKEPDRFSVIRNTDLSQTIVKATKVILQLSELDTARKTLSKKGGEQLTLRATVVRPGKSKVDGKPTLLLKDVRQKHGRKILTEHIWIPYTRSVVKGGTLMPNDVIEFTATVADYQKTYRKQTITEYGLTDIHSVKLVKQHPQPEGLYDEWERNDLSYIHSVEIEELFERLLLRYVNFVSAMVYKYYKGEI